MRFILFFLFLMAAATGQAQKLSTLFEQSKGTRTPAYADVISWWQKLDALSPIVRMEPMGPTDAGFPLHLVLVSADQDFNISSLKRKRKSIIFINNGIHPGEPDGIDASMLLARDIAEGREPIPANVVLAFIPVYNIGGALNRSAWYRVNQNGPEEFGFRGNSQNLDLNRDFIKSDSKEARTFAQIFHMLDPDVFVDNHVSNGADYQHVMTLLTTQHNKLGGRMGEFLNTRFEPALFQLMKEKGFDLVPYVNHSSHTPDKGWLQFWDSPRYSSGYATLWSTFAFVPETHMLKPYAQRVQATYALMQSFMHFVSQHSSQITELRTTTRQEQSVQHRFPVAWKRERTQFTMIDFRGYEATMKPSAVSGQPRLFYDRSKPLQLQVPFYNRFTDSITIDRPAAYIIPQGWWKVLELLRINNVRMSPLPADTTLEVEHYRIRNYTSSPRPFEGHHLNSGVQVSVATSQVRFRKGDVLIRMNQKANRFLMEVLEPQAEDSYFAWNFFDAILGQKEGFSDYAFEETAVEILQQRPDIRSKLEERRAADTAFARNGAAQLNFIFQLSPYYEPAHMQVPVYRLMKPLR